MSLKVWLPLDGDLRNLGTTDFTYTTSIVGGYEPGKIGQALSLLNSQLIFTIPALSGVTKFSIAFWYKPRTNTTLTGNWYNIIALMAQSADASVSAAWRCESSYNNTYAISHHNNVGNPIDDGHSQLATEKDIWYHICLTCDGINSTKAYVNGIIHSTKQYQGGHLTGRVGIADETSKPDGLLNDVRIYDHCLSAAEVHEIAQGLVLHYKLEGPMGGSGINLLQGSNKIGDSNNYGWIRKGSYTDFSIEKLEGNIIHYRGTISNNKYIPSITTNTVAPCEFGKTYTYQMELKFDKDITLSTNVPMHFWAGCRNTDNITNVSCNGNLTGITYSFVQNHSGTLTANTWVKIITQITFPSAATTTGYDYPAIRAFVYGGVLPEAYTGEVNVWMRNCKIEEGTVATNWSFAPEDLGIDTTIVEDSSGYGHNGEIINSITLQADSPRYSKSMHFSATNQKIKISNFPTSGFGDSYTFAWWGKTASTSPMQWGFRDGIRLNGMYKGKLWNTGDASSNPIYIPGTTTQVTAPTTGVWHHYVMTGDGNTCKVYLDGVFWGQAKTYKSISGTTIYINGWDETTSYASSNFSISDFRIYCTPLLDTDIKLLYNMSMRIDNLNTLHTFELNEQQYPSPIYSSETGSILTFNNKRLNNLIVNIEPVQNFNGYDSPWSGGSGKNLLPNLIKGIGINSTNGTEITNADYAASDYISITLISENSYYISGLSNQLHTFVAAYNSSKEFLGRTSGRTNTGFQITLGNLSNGTPSGTGDIAYLRVTIYKTGTDTGTIDLVDNLQVQLEAGSAATSYAPYSNICPITGWTGATVRRTGKNLLNDTSRYIGGSNNVYLSFEGDRNSFPTFLRAAQYTLSVEFLNDAHYGAYIRNGDETVAATLWSASSSTTQMTFTLPYDDYYRIWLYKSDGVSSDNVGCVQLELGSVATAYEPYQGDTYTVDWEDDAGTVYGGTLDLVAGTLTVDRAFSLLNNPDKWEAYSGTVNFIYNVEFVNRKKYDNSYDGLICSYMVVNRAGQNTLTARWTGAISNKFGLRWVDGSIDQVKADAQTGKIAIVYELAEPIIYTLDPIMLTTLLGTNTLWADSGNITIQYRTPQTARLMKTGTLITDEYQEANKTSIYQNGIVEATKFIEI